MADLSHWDFAEFFTADEAANLILGFDGLDRMAASREKSVPIIIRMSQDYHAAHSSLRTLIYRKSSTALAEKHKGLVSNELQNQFDFEFVFSDEEGDTKGFNNWLGGEYGRFKKQTFSRVELARWLKAIGLQSVYQFDIGGAGDTELEPTQPQSRWPWGDYHTENLGHIESAIKKFWVNFDPSDNTTAPTNETVIAWLKERGLSENLAKSIASIIRADGLPTGKRT